jgi:D-proline reductase (dithiol) PrdB
MPVDSFKYLPRLIATFYQMMDRTPELPVPWTPLARPLSECTLAWVTSAGLHHRSDPPFDLDRERREPTWGDPGFRTLPIPLPSEDLRVSHLHINPDPILQDLNVVLPQDRMAELVESGRVGAFAPQAFSFMGYQGYPADTSGWESDSGPAVAARLQELGVDGVLLTPV